MATLKKVAQNSFFYTISSILLRASSIIFFPIFSLYLTKSDYGIISITQSIGAFVTLFAGLELSNALTRFIFNEENNKEINHDKLIFNVLVSSFLFGLVLVLILSLFGPFILSPILNDIPFFPYVFVFLLTIPLNSFINTCRVYLKATHKGFKAFTLDTSFFSVNIVFNLLLVVGFKMDALGIFLGTFLNTLIFSIILSFVFYRKWKFGLSFPLLQDLLRYSLPLIPFSLLNILFESVDKFFLNNESGSNASGIYYIALTFATIFSSAKEALINAFTPWLFSNIMRKSEKEIQNIILSIFIGAGFIAIGITWFSREILTILSSNPEFILAAEFIPYTVVSLYIIFLGQLYNIKTYYFGKYNKFLFLATFTGIVTDVISCYLLIEPYGIKGAAVARIISFTVSVIAIIYLSNLEKEKREIYSARKLTLTLIIISSLSILPVMLNIETMLFTLIKVLVYLALTTIILTYLNKKFKLKSLFSKN